MPSAAILTIGSELLLGKVVDTNGAYLGEVLSSAGFDVRKRISVGDHKEEINRWVRILLSDTDLIVTTGGLGPTKDDLTRDGVADALGVPLRFQEYLLREIEEIFASRGFHMTENNHRQAYLPEGAQLISNPVGTAPAFYYRTKEGKEIVCLPGVPGELKFLVERKVIPHLQEAFNISGHLKRTRILKVCGLGESGVDQQIGDLMKMEGNPVVGLLASPGMIRILITAEGNNEKEVVEKIGPVEQEIRRRLGGLIFGADDQTLEGVVLEKLAKTGGTLSIKDAATGGEVLRRLLAVFDGRYYLEGSLDFHYGSPKGEDLDGAGEASDIRIRINSMAPSEGKLKIFEVSIQGKGKEKVVKIPLGGAKGEVETRLAVIAIDQLRKWLDDVSVKAP